MHYVHLDKLRHWRGARGIYALKAAPVLELAL